MNAIRPRAALALCCSLAMTAPVLGQTVVAGPQGKSDARKVIVTANATTHVKPNAVRLSFVVTSQTQANIREDNDQQVAKMKKGIAELALANLQVHVVPSSINTLQVTERRVAGPGVGGFAGGGGPGGGGVGVGPARLVPVQTKQIQTLFVVTLRDAELERLGGNVRKLVDLVVENGGMASSDDVTGIRAARLLGTGVTESFPGPRIEWLAEDAGDARRQAIKRAVKEAAENARAAVGDQANLQVAEIDIAVPEENPAIRRFRPDVPTSETGLIPVNVEVKVTFTYQ